MKKIVVYLSIILLVSTLFIPSIFANIDWIYSKSKEAVYSCINKPSNSIPNPIDKKRILICKWEDSHDRLYQAALDVLFTDIDLKIESHLESLPKEKIKIEEMHEQITKKFWIGGNFYKSYKEVCDFWTIQYASKFIKDTKENLKLKDLTTDWKTPDLLKSYGWKCNSLFKVKLKAYEDVAWLIVQRNLKESYEKDKKTFVKKLNEKYENFLFKFNILLWQLWVITAKWNKKTKDAKNK